MLARTLTRRALGAAAGSSTVAAFRKPLFPTATAAAYVRAFGSGGDRSHLRPSGGKIEGEDIENYHEPDLSMINRGPPQTIVEERGQKWVVGQEHRPFNEIYQADTVNPDHLPYWPRQRCRIFCGDWLINKCEFLFAYIPTVIIFLLVMPAFNGIYMQDETLMSTMVVKVTGRQWFWIYEVESPTDDGDDDE